MANRLYDSARAQFAKGELKWHDMPSATIAGTLRVYLVTSADSGYVQSDTHDYLDRVAPASREFGESGSDGLALGSPAVDPNGAVTGQDVRFVSVGADKPEIKGVIIANYTGADATSPLIYYADSASGLPITPNGGDIIVTWNTGTNKIFRL